MISIDKLYKWNIKDIYTYKQYYEYVNNKKDINKCWQDVIKKGLAIKKNKRIKN